MLGISTLVTRTELLHMKATGTAQEFSDWVQKNILDYGHQVEALARPLVEELIGEDLYPVTCSDGRLSASCDGLTMAKTSPSSTSSGTRRWPPRSPPASCRTSTCRSRSRS
jgi:predicted phage-related endonuclease